MNREEILKAAQNSGEVNDEYERSVSRKGISYAVMAAMSIVVAMCLAEIFIKKSVDYGKFVIVFAMSSIMDIYEGRIENNKKSMRNGIVTGIIAVVFLGVYIGALIK